MKEEQYVSGQTKYPPLVSPMLVKRTVRGMRLTVTGFTGPYTLPDNIESQTDHIVLETVLTDLLSLGVPNPRIKRESYG